MPILHRIASARVRVAMFLEDGVHKSKNMAAYMEISDGICRQ